MTQPPYVLVTVADYLTVPGVVRVLDCVPGEGHVTLVVEPGCEGLAARLVAEDRTVSGLQLHERTARDR